MRSYTQRIYGLFSTSLGIHLFPVWPVHIKYQMNGSNSGRMKQLHEHKLAHVNADKLDMHLLSTLN